MPREREDIRAQPRERTSDKLISNPTVDRLSAASRTSEGSTRRLQTMVDKGFGEHSSETSVDSTSSSTDSARDTHGFSSTSARHSMSQESRGAAAYGNYSSSREGSAARQDDAQPRHHVQSDKNRYHQRFREAARAEENNTRTSKLNFADDDLSHQDAVNRKLERAQARAERFEKRTHKAERKLPSRRRLRVDVSADPATGKSKQRLRFEKEIKDQSAALNGPAALKPVKVAAGMAGGMIHNQIYRNEQENVGIQAAHRAELAGEAGLRYANRARKLAPYNKVKRLQGKTINAQAKAAYQKALADNPALKKKGLAKLAYKKRLKRKYAKAARDAYKKEIGRAHV